MHEQFQRENRFLVLKWADIEKYLSREHRESIRTACAVVEERRRMDGKRRDSYVVVADDWPEYEETWAKIQARMTGATPDVVTVPREEWEALRELEHQAWSALDEVENHGECDMTGISGAYKAVKESIALRSGEVVATPQDTVAVPKFESYHIPSFVRFPDGGYRGSFDYGFRRGWQKLASLLGDKGAIEAEKAQSKSDSWSEWDQLNRESGVGQ